MLETRQCLSSVSVAIYLWYAVYTLSPLSVILILKCKDCEIFMRFILMPSLHIFLLTELKFYKSYTATSE